MTRVNNKYRKNPLLHWEEDVPNLLYDNAAIETWRAEREAFLAERKRRNDEEAAERLRARREREEQERRDRRNAQNAERSARRKAKKRKADAAVMCNFEFSPEACDNWTSDIPWDPGDTIHTTVAFVERWLHDKGIDVRH